MSQKKAKTDKEKELLDALEGMVNHACLGMGNILDSMSVTAYADAMRLLAEYGRIKITGESGKRVIGEWVK